MAVHTDVLDQEIAGFVSGYALGSVVASKGIAEGVENMNYLLAATSATYILTLYEKRVKPADLPFFLSLMEHLAAHGVPCPAPIRFLLTRLYDWLHRCEDAAVLPKNPTEYLQKLRFHRRLSGPEGYGLE